MISQQKAKYIKSLQVKKYRKKHRAFLIEGAKSVIELINSQYNIRFLACTQSFSDKNAQLLSKPDTEIILTTKQQLESVGTLKTNDAALAVADIPDNDLDRLGGEVILLLDNVKDPGNLGTIIRTADWYGLTSIVLSENSADLYNPKVLQSTMGSFTRVNCIYTDLNSFIKQHTYYHFYAATMRGTNIHSYAFQKPAALVMGNESTGVSATIQQEVKHHISIPRFGDAESLNVAMATGIILDNIFR